MTTTIRILVATAVATLGAASVARADEGSGYRAEMAIASSASLGVLYLGAATEREGRVLPEVLMATGGIGSFLVGPAVHVRHHAYQRAAVSFAMRLALPIAGGLIGGRLADCSGGQSLCGLNEMAMGMVVGAVIAPALDVALLAGAREGEEEAAPTPAPRAGASLSPRIMATSERAFVGVGGLF